MTDSKTETEILVQWYSGIRLANIRHRMSKNYYAQKSRTLGISVIVVTAIVGATIFLDVSIWTQKYEVVIKLCTGFLSVLATILASMQTFLNYSELSEKHNIAAVKYGSLRREIDLFIINADKKYPLHEKLESVQHKWDAIDKEAPSIAKKIYDKATKKCALKPVQLGSLTESS